ncbi:MAG: hypothetical protein Q9159_001158 [Coniocarpon cinnabarinum]
MPNVRFNESYTPSHPPKNARPREDSTPSLNRTFTFSSDTGDYSPNSGMQHYTTAAPNASTDQAVFSTRDGHCAKCNHPFGKITNKFRKVTGSYYQNLDEGALGRVELRPDGPTKALSPKNDPALNGTAEKPLILPNPQAQTLPTASSPTHDDTLSPSPSRTAPMPQLEHPDYEAARGIMAKEPWSTVHEQWERRTHERLSPSTFGKRILPVVHEIQTSQRREHRSHSRDSSEVRPIANGRSIPQANGITQAESTRHRFADSMETQRADINRLDGALSSIQAEMSQLKGLMAEMRYEIQSGVRRSHEGQEDSATLDALADQVHRITSRAGEIDGLRFEMTALKGKLKRMEETSVVPPTPQQSHSAIPPRTTETPVQPPPSRHQDIAPRGWNAVNVNKRKSLEASPNMVEAHKRPRSEYHTATRDAMPAYGPHVATAPAPPPPALAPIRSSSQEPWQAEAQRLPPIRGMHQSGMHQSSRGNIRPATSRLNPAQEPGVVDWEHDPWEHKHVEIDSCHRPLAGSARPPLSPGAHKRGTLVRRGTSGSSAPLQYVDPGPTKRTRQRPIRNEHGILIRKDGKPDQRSISSPQNLRKVHERRMAEQDKGSQGSPEDALSPVDTDGPKSTGDYNSAIGSSGSGSPGYDQISPVEPPDSRPPSDSGLGPASKHEKVMHKMFPHGLVEGAQRMNHAAHIFDHGSQEHEHAELRKDMEKHEAQEFDDAAGDVMEVDAAPVESANKARSDPVPDEASGSLYEPSQTQQTQAESKTATDDSADPSSSKISSIRVRSSFTQDSDNRPLRVRELADDREASGSMYEPSPHEDVSVE